MMINSLDRSAYLSYVNDPMRFYDNPDDMAELDLATYLTEMLAAEHPELTLDQLKIEYALEDGTQRYEHIALGYGRKNVVIVLVTDKRQILGHFLLDLNEEYGLSD